MKKFLLFALAMLLSYGLYAQFQGYNHSSSTRPYVALPTTAADVTLSQDWDDEIYEIPIGFNFTFLGEVFDSLIIETNGELLFISLNDALNLNTADTIPIFNGFGNLELGADLISRGTSVSTSPIRTQLSGPVGNRILKIEWVNAGFYSDASETDFVNFQIWIKEAGNVIESHIGPNSVNASSYNVSSGAVIGVARLHVDPILEIFNYIDGLYLSGSASAPVASQNFGTISGTPAANSLFVFTPSTVNVPKNELLQINLFPNPANNILQIEQEYSKMNLQIFSVDGKLLNTTTLIPGTSQIDVSSLASGIYFANFINEKGETSRNKFVISR